MSEPLNRLSLSLERLINAALAQGDWDQAEALAADIGGEFDNAGIGMMITSMIEQVEVLCVEDQRLYVQSVRSALSRKDADEARRLLAEKRERHRAVHDHYIGFMAEMMSKVVDLWGEAGLERLLRQVGEASRATMFDPAAALDMDARVALWAKALRNHLGKIEVTEDSEKYTIRQDPCGSGGRLMRSGRFDGEGALRRVSGQGLTLGVEDLPSYCTHCPVWLAHQHAEWYGHPEWVIEPPSANQSPCLIHLYKDPGQIPVTFLARLTAQGTNEPAR